MPKTDGTGMGSLPPKVQGAQANQDKRAQGNADDVGKNRGGGPKIEASRNKPLRGGGSSSRT